MSPDELAAIKAAAQRIAAATPLDPARKAQLRILLRPAVTAASRRRAA